MPSSRESKLHIDFAPLATTVQELPVAIYNRIRREKKGLLRSHYQGLDVIVPLMVRVAENTWKTIQLLCGEESQRLALEVAVSVPPLARSILDALFTFVLIFDDPVENTRWYYASGWREASAYHARLENRYGGDPRWQEWLHEHKSVYIDGWEVDAHVSAEEKARPTMIKWWPNPGGMVNRTTFKDPERQAFLRFLNDWYYSTLSGDSHLSLIGLARRGGALSDFGESNNRTEMLHTYRSRLLVDSMALYIALLSEIAAELSLTLELERLKQIWGHLLVCEDTKDLYFYRYERWFSGRG